MYQLELMCDKNLNRSVNIQYPNYINMLVRVTNGKITTKDPDVNVIPDFSNPDYYVVGLENTIQRLIARPCTEDEITANEPGWKTR